MGRPPKNPNHVLVRLRKAISTDNHVITRKMLAERVGISPSTLRQIEIGGFQLTRAVAHRIMLATNVSTESLLKNEDPLRDVSGKKLKAEYGAGELSEIYYQTELSNHHLLTAAFKAAKEKNRSFVFNQLFRESLAADLAAIGAIPTTKMVLTRNLGRFDPMYVPSIFWPEDPKTRRKWEKAQSQLFMSVHQEAGFTEAHPFQASAADMHKLDEAYQAILSSGRLREEHAKKRPPKPSNG